MIFTFRCIGQRIMYATISFAGHNDPARFTSAYLCLVHSRERGRPSPGNDTAAQRFYEASHRTKCRPRAGARLQKRQKVPYTRIIHPPPVKFQQKVLNFPFFIFPPFLQLICPKNRRKRSIPRQDTAFSFRMHFGFQKCFPLPPRRDCFSLRQDGADADAFTKPPAK